MDNSQQNKKENTSNNQVSSKKEEVNSTKKPEPPKKEETPKKEEVQEPPKKEEQEKPHQHMFSVNGGWYKTESNAVSAYDREVEKWEAKYNNGELTYEELTKNCPCGYEVYRCTCGEQGLNLLYR